MNSDKKKFFLRIYLRLNNLVFAPMDNDPLTERILGAVFEVSNTLGAGFLEKVYERALLLELRLRGIGVVSQASFSVIYKGQRVGEYFADILVENAVVIELKCVERLGKEHIAQCLNYLHAARLDVCLLINFQKPAVEWRRIVCATALSASR